MEQESLLLQLPQRGREPADGHRVWGETLMPNPSLKSPGWPGGDVPAQGPLPSCESPALSGAPSGPHLQNPAPPYSLVITDADDRPHQETPLCPRTPPLARQRGPAPQLCLLRALAVNDAEEHVDGGLRGHAAGAMSHSQIAHPPTHPPTGQAPRRPTVGAPSISSITRQLGFPPMPSTDSICVAASMCVRKASGLRSSL